MSIQLFLAHASEDKAAVLELYEQLKAKGFKPWVDKQDLIPGQNWRDEIPKAIRNSQLFIACLSPRFVSKQGYVHKEFRLALDAYAEKPLDSIYLIPLKLEPCEVPDIRLEQLGIRLRDLHWVDYWESDGFDMLMRAIDYQIEQLQGRETNVATPSTAELSQPEPLNAVKEKLLREDSRPLVMSKMSGLDRETPKKTETVNREAEEEKDRISVGLVNELFNALRSYKIEVGIDKFKLIAHQSLFSKGKIDQRYIRKQFTRAFAASDRYKQPVQIISSRPGRTKIGSRMSKEEGKEIIYSIARSDDLGALPGEVRIFFPLSGKEAKISGICL